MHSLMTSAARRELANDRSGQKESQFRDEEGYNPIRVSWKAFERV